MMRRMMILLAGLTLGIVGLLSSAAQEPKKAEKPEIPGGIEGHIKSVDHEKQTLTIVGSTGRERTFSIKEDTMMVGPRGGKVRRRLNDRRFHEGLEITVVANGDTAKELHLGFNRRTNEETGAQAKKTTGPLRKRRIAEAEAERAKKEEATSTDKVDSKSTTKTTPAAEEEDEDDEIPGKVKSYITTGRTPVLVVSLLNGKNRSFFLSSEVKVLVKGKPSTLGLKDPAIKADAPLTVLVHPGSSRVAELHVNPLPPARAKKAA